MNEYHSHDLGWWKCEEELSLRVWKGTRVTIEMESVRNAAQENRNQNNYGALILGGHFIKVNSQTFIIESAFFEQQ